MLGWLRLLGRWAIRILIATIGLAAAGLLGGAIALGGYELFRVGVKVFRNARERRQERKERRMQRRQRRLEKKAQKSEKARVKSALGKVLAGGALALGGYEILKSADKGTMKDFQKAVRRHGYKLLYDRKTGWRVENLPKGVKARLEDMFSDSISMDVNGHQGAIRAVREGKSVVYSVPLDGRSAGMVSSKLAEDGHPYWLASVSKGKDGKLYLYTLDINLAHDYASRLFPVAENKVDVVRSLTETRQWQVTGCKTYEEALQHVQDMKAMREAGKPVPKWMTQNATVANTFITDSVSVDGAVSERVSGEALNPSVVQLPTGAFLVNESVTSGSHALMKIPADVQGHEAMADFVRGKSEELKPSPGLVTKFTDGMKNETGQTMEFTRFISHNGHDFRDVSVSDDLTLKKNKAYIVLNETDLKSLAVNGCIPSNARMVYGDRPELRPGQFLAEVDLSNPKALGTLMAADRDIATKGISRECGIPESKVRLSMLEDAANNPVSPFRSPNGKLYMVNRQDIPGEAVKVNGVPLNEINGRATDQRMGAMDNRKLGEWVQDVSKIENVEMSIDPQSKSMFIRSTVGGHTRLETKQLTDKEFQAISQRGFPKSHELKDLLLQLNPQFFGTYASKGGAVQGGKAAKTSVFINPFESFIFGRRPDDKSIKGRVDNTKRQAAKKADTVKKAVTKAVMKKFGR